MTDRYLRCRRLALLGLVLIAGATWPRPGRAQPGEPARQTGERPTIWLRALQPRVAMVDRLLQQAEAHNGRKEYGKAAGLVRRALEVLPTSASLWHSLATLASHQGRYAECVPAMVRSRQLDPTHRPSDAAFTLGLCYSLTGRLAEGTEEYLKVTPGQTVSAGILYYNLGDNLMAMGRVVEAVAYYRRALTENPGSTILYYALAVALDRQGRRPAALAQLRRAVRLDPQGAALIDPAILWFPPQDLDYFQGARSAVLHRRLESLGHFRSFHRKEPAGQWRWAQRRWLEDLRTAPLEAEDLRLGPGPVNAAVALAELRPAQASLRQCLGPAPAAVDRDADQHVGVRVVVDLGDQGPTRVAVEAQVGGPGPGTLDCLTGRLRALKLGRALARGQTGRLVFELVGP
jgi:tetratricopeptide (TPR) repeat protein